MDEAELKIAQRLAAEHPRPLLFATVSGAHLYGFPSPDSDIDLRGAHVATPEEACAIHDPDAMGTLERDGILDGREIDLVTHEARKFFTLLLKKNGYVLEQVLSPLIVVTNPLHEELKAIAPETVTRFHAFHYIGFSRTQRDLFHKEAAPRVKPLLYVYRVLLTGIHLMKTGAIEANLRHLNDLFRLPYIDDLIARKTAGEQATLTDADLSFHDQEHDRLTGELEAAMNTSSLPDTPSPKALPALNDLLFRIRRESLSSKACSSLFH